MSSTPPSTCNACMSTVWYTSVEPSTLHPICGCLICHKCTTLSKRDPHGIVGCVLHPTLSSKLDPRVFPLSSAGIRAASLYLIDEQLRTVGSSVDIYIGRDKSKDGNDEDMKLGECPQLPCALCSCKSCSKIGCMDHSGDGVGPNLAIVYCLTCRYRLCEGHESTIHASQQGPPSLPHRVVLLGFEDKIRHNDLCLVHNYPIVGIDLTARKGLCPMCYFEAENEEGKDAGTTNSAQDRPKLKEARILLNKRFVTLFSEVSSSRSSRTSPSVIPESQFTQPTTEKKDAQKEGDGRAGEQQAGKPILRSNTPTSFAHRLTEMSGVVVAMKKLLSSLDDLKQAAETRYVAFKMVKGDYAPIIHTRVDSVMMTLQKAVEEVKQVILRLYHQRRRLVNSVGYALRMYDTSLSSLTFDNPGVTTKELESVVEKRAVDAGMIGEELETLGTLEAIQEIISKGDPLLAAITQKSMNTLCRCLSIDKTIILLTNQKGLELTPHHDTDGIQSERKAGNEESGKDMPTVGNPGDTGDVRLYQECNLFVRSIHMIATTLFNAVPRLTSEAYWEELEVLSSRSPSTAQVLLGRGGYDEYIDLESETMQPLTERTYNELQKQGENGQPTALAIKGMIFVKRSDLSPTALELLLNAEKLGCDSSLLLKYLGDAYLEVQGPNNDPMKAIEYYQKSATKGCASALVALSALHQRGSPQHVSKGARKSFCLLNDAVNKDGITHPLVLVALGKKHEKGEGTPANGAAAANYYKLAMEQGFGDGYIALSLLMTSGAAGFPKDTERALNILVEAERKGVKSRRLLAQLCDRYSRLSRNIGGKSTSKEIDTYRVQLLKYADELIAMGDYSGYCYKAEVETDPKGRLDILLGAERAGHATSRILSQISSLYQEVKLKDVPKSAAYEIRAIHLATEPFHISQSISKLASTLLSTTITTGINSDALRLVESSPACVRVLLSIAGQCQSKVVSERTALEDRSRYKVEARKFAARARSLAKTSDDIYRTLQLLTSLHAYAPVDHSSRFNTWMEMESKGVATASTFLSLAECYREGLGTKPDGRKVLDYADKAIAAATSRDQQIIKQAYNHKAHVFRFGIYPIAKSATNLEVVWKEAEKAGHCREEDRDLEARWLSLPDMKVDESVQAQAPPEAASGDKPSSLPIIKCVLLGGTVGKSTFIGTLTKCEYYNDYIATIGIDFATKTFDLPSGDRVKAQVWDTAGNERFHTITSAYLRGVHCVAIMYDITDAASFLKLNYWLDFVSKHAPDPPNNPKVMILGAFCEETGRRAVDKDVALMFAREKGALFCEVSSRSHTNVEESMKMLIEATWQKLQIAGQSEGSKQPKSLPKMEEEMPKSKGFLRKFFG